MIADPTSWLLLCRTVRFGDTDAAGVMHFHQLLRWCHEAYEESLERYGLAPAEVFPRPDWAGEAPPIGLPIVACGAEFRRPLLVGDPLSIQLSPEALGSDGFEVSYAFSRGEEPVARGFTRHLAIAADSRRRCPLPEGIRRWLEASGLSQGIRPL